MLQEGLICSLVRQFPNSASQQFLVVARLVVERWEVLLEQQLKVYYLRLEYLVLDEVSWVEKQTKEPNKRLKLKPKEQNRQVQNKPKPRLKQKKCNKKSKKPRQIFRVHNKLLPRENKKFIR